MKAMIGTTTLHYINHLKKNIYILRQKVDHAWTFFFLIWFDFDFFLLRNGDLEVLFVFNLVLIWVFISIKMCFVLLEMEI